MIDMKTVYLYSFMVDQRLKSCASGWYFLVPPSRGMIMMGGTGCGLAAALLRVILQALKIEAQGEQPNADRLPVFFAQAGRS